MSSFARRFSVGVALALTVLAVPVSAQTFRVAPQVGVFANARDYPDHDPSLFVTEGSDRSSRLALGLALEVGFPGRPILARLGGVYGLESEVPVVGVICIESPCAAVLAGTLALAGDVVVELPSPESIRPYLLGGLGLKRWSVNREVGPGSFVESQTRFAGHLGAGVELDAPWVGVSLELHDYITAGADEGGPSIGDGTARHDLFVMVGVSLSR